MVIYDDKTKNLWNNIENSPVIPGRKLEKIEEAIADSLYSHDLSQSQTSGSSINVEVPGSCIRRTKLNIESIK